jgi:hypothetical protein
VQKQLGGDVGVGLEAEEAEFGDGHFGTLARVFVCLVMI